MLKALFPLYSMHHKLWCIEIRGVRFILFTAYQKETVFDNGINTEFLPLYDINRKKIRSILFTFWFPKRCNLWNLFDVFSEPALNTIFLSLQVETWPARPYPGTHLTFPPLGRAATPPLHLLEWCLVRVITVFTRALILGQLVIISTSPQQLIIFEKPEVMQSRKKCFKEKNFCTAEY